MLFPPLSGALEDLCRDFLKVNAIFVGPGIKTGMPIRYDNPREVGADRIVNAVAMYEKYRSDLIAVDFGTRPLSIISTKRVNMRAGQSRPASRLLLKPFFSRHPSSSGFELTLPPPSLPKTLLRPFNPGSFWGTLLLWMDTEKNV